MNLTTTIDGVIEEVTPLIDGNDEINRVREREAFDHAYELCEQHPGKVIAIVVNTVPALPPVGARIKLTHDVERFPHFIARKGDTGTVVHSDDAYFNVRIDRHIPGAEEWDNEIIWILRDDDKPMEDVEEVKVYMDFRFDVTKLTDEERGHLAGYVSAQAEGSDDSEAYYPSVDFEQDLVEVEVDG